MTRDFGTFVFTYMYMYLVSRIDWGLVPSLISMWFHTFKNFVW